MPHTSSVLTPTIEDAVPAGRDIPSRVSSFVPWILVCLAWSAMLAFDDRYVIDPDGVSYLDMAAQALRHGVGSLVNGLWSPGYPAVLAAAIGVFHPAPENVIPLAHFVNWLLFAAATLAFAWVLRGLLPRQEEGTRWRPILVPVSFGIFFWIASQFIDVAIVKPDLLGTVLVLVAGGICLRLRRSRNHWWLCAGLGLALAGAYYARAALLPLGLALLVILFLFPPTRDRGRVKVLAATAVFLLASAPLIVAMSAYVGHFSTGEAGRLNYLWYVHGLEPVHAGWTGDARFGVPIHGPRLVQADPRLITWKGSPVPGTYPLWYDPWYFHAGASAPFNVKEQLRILGSTLPEYFAGLQEMSALVMAAAALLLFGRSGRKWLQRIPRSQFWMVLWLFAACGLFSLVHVETRYYAAFAILFWVAIFRWCSGLVERRVEQAILSVAVITLLMPMALSIPAKAAHLAAGLTGRSPQPAYRLVERRLVQLGLHPGDPIAGIGLTSFYAFGAQTAGLRFIAEAPNREQFWRLTPAQRREVVDTFRALGAKAVLAHEDSPYPQDEGWQVIPDSGYKVLPLTASAR